MYSCEMVGSNLLVAWRSQYCRPTAGARVTSARERAALDRLPQSFAPSCLRVNLDQGRGLWPEEEEVGAADCV